MCICVFDFCVRVCVCVCACLRSVRGKDTLPPAVHSVPPLMEGKKREIVWGERARVRVEISQGEREKITREFIEVF